jgi:hypothetical protein
VETLKTVGQTDVVLTQNFFSLTTHLSPDHSWRDDYRQVCSEAISSDLVGPEWDNIWSWCCVRSSLSRLGMIVYLLQLSSTGLQQHSFAQPVIHFTLLSFAQVALA